MSDMAFRDVYPLWDAETFRMAGVDITNEQTCVSAFKAARQALSNKGGMCPCCGQHVQVYQRSIYKRMALCLKWLIPEYQAREGAWVALKDGPLFHGGDNAKLIYWKLMVRHPVDRSLYKPTRLAVSFLRGELSVPKYAYVYNGKVWGFSPEVVSFDECTEFDFSKDDIGIRDWHEDDEDE